MNLLNVPTINGNVKEKIFEIEGLAYLGKLFNCSESHKRKITYLEIPAAFDIETNNVTPSDAGRPYAFMYHWQFCLDEQVVFGRTWKEFQQLISTLQQRMNLDNYHRLVVWVHNLGFEFQFFKRFFKIIDGFYKDEHSPLKVVVDGGIEFRDSYALSNMNLQKFCENSPNVTHYKLSGEEYNYKIFRTPYDELKENEKAYCYNDVRGLCECIKSRLNGDTLSTIPMTSTGYVRRACRKAMAKNKKNRKIFHALELSPELYKKCRAAFRGGDTHANYKFVNKTIINVHSFDITSSYPASMLMDKYPMTAFTKITLSTFKKLSFEDHAMLIDIALKDVKYKGNSNMTYIPVSKCTALGKHVEDNGRVLKAEFLSMTVTEIDYQIIMNEYDFSEIRYGEIYCAKKDYLPEEFREVVREYYRKKTALKGVDGKEYEYLRAKMELNALYGMMVMRLDNPLVTFDGKEFHTEETPLEELLKKYYGSRNSFLCYQWGVWVTANSRKRLRDMITVIGKDCVYCDTDSIKFIGDHEKDFEKINDKIKAEAINAGAYATNKDGVTYYLGTWDHDGDYVRFRTLGAKKYLVEEINKKGEHEILSTIAGVKKSAGQKFFTEHGFESFRVGTVIPDSGHLVAYYNDDDIHFITDDKGRKIETASNVALIDDTYTIGISDDFQNLLNRTLDGIEDIEYI